MRRPKIQYVDLNTIEGLRTKLEQINTMVQCTEGIPEDALDPVFALCVLHQGLRGAYKQLWTACKAWIDWMDSPGDGTDKTLKDEDKMLQAMRVAIKKWPINMGFRK